MNKTSAAFLRRGAATSRAHSAAFTLIEILVVVAIIGILVALILPALGNAKRNAQQATSISNLRKWGAAAGVATGENDGYLPSDGTVPGRELTEESAWFNRFPKAVQLTAFGKLVNHPKLGEKSLWINPIASKQDGDASGTVFTYGFNDYLSTVAEPMMKVANIERPSRTILMAEKKPDIEPAVNENSVLSRYGAGASDPTHDDAIADFLFCDGHVESVKRSVFNDPKGRSGSKDDMVKAAVNWIPYEGQTTK